MNVWPSDPAPIAAIFSIRKTFNVRRRTFNLFQYLHKLDACETCLANSKQKKTLVGELFRPASTEIHWKRDRAVVTGSRGWADSLNDLIAYFKG